MKRIAVLLILAVLLLSCAAPAELISIYAGKEDAASSGTELPEEESSGEEDIASSGTELPEEETAGEEEREEKRFDLSSYSDEDLLILQKELSGEIAARKITGRTATGDPGIYVCGEDFPEGNYIFTALAHGTGYYIYPDRDMKKESEHDSYMSKDDTVYLRLKNGNVLKVIDNRFSLTVSAGLVFE